MSERPSVLLLETIDASADDALRSRADVVLSNSPSPDDTVRAAAGRRFDAIMTRGKGRVSAELLDVCPGLRVVARCGVGLDNVDVASASARGVRVLNVPGCNAQTIAEHAMMLMLAVGRGLVECANAVRQGDWGYRNSYDRDELNGKTAGIVGLGNIGSRFARMCEAMAMTVVYSDESDRAGVGYARLPLDELLAAADVVSLHCPLNDQTRGLMGAGRLGRMKRGAILINTARGGLIDQEALVAALRSGGLSGFGADVLDVEPPPTDHPLLSIPHVVITPHSGGLTRTTYRDSCVRSVNNVLSVLAGDEPEPGCVFNAAALAHA